MHCRCAIEERSTIFKSVETLLSSVQDDVDVGHCFTRANRDRVDLQRYVVSRLVFLPVFVLAGVGHRRIQRARRWIRRRKSC